MRTIDEFSGAQKNEVLMRLNKYSEIDIVNGNSAVIEHIMNVVLGNTRYFSIPDEVFIDIKQFRHMETNKFVSFIKKKIEDTISKYLPDNNVQEVHVRRMDRERVLIGFKFFNDDDIYIADTNIDKDRIFSKILVK